MPPRKTKSYKGEGWKVQVGDCCNLIRNWEHAPRLVFADPPFNIGQKYAAYRDLVEPEEYIKFTNTWIRLCSQALHCQGILAVNCPDRLVFGILKATQELQQVAWIIWHYRFGQCGRSNWINSKNHCLIFAKDPDNYQFHPGLVESDRSTVYSDPRTQDSATPGVRVPFDVWGVPSDGPYWGRVQGNNKERREGHPNQLPEVYLQRLITAYTRPDDLVADPFVGSGTTPTVAVSMRRRFIGCEISSEAAASAAARIRKGMVRAAT
jgi:DNA modification methylase